MSGPDLSTSHLGSLARSSHSLCLESDQCGPLASHPYCVTHCTAKHITYQSTANNCFGSLQC